MDLPHQAAPSTREDAHCRHIFPIPSMSASLLPNLQVESGLKLNQDILN
jgi:hypothetical protein